jgi:hypothetical protein
VGGIIRLGGGELGFCLQPWNFRGGSVSRGMEVFARLDENMRVFFFLSFLFENADVRRKEER